ncbi:uncharacterized protein DUF4232 [Saccharothrix australiensis]|uniref:Uncharacterized protein DUF4232 n=2 Tax=Saccharothrix australiensis TaxID=2072 RepID=A0A495VZ52_9PSEU|nr:uncharacterized protein DUF4232 [Saccharothrix australiensis]
MQGADKPGVGLLAVTNRGTTPLTVQGWPIPSFTNLSGAPAAIPVEQVLIPGEGPSITLQPGQTAFAGVQLALGDAASGSAIGSMKVEVPGGASAEATLIGTDGRPISDPGSLKVSSAKVGTLQPTAQGVLVF